MKKLQEIVKILNRKKIAKVDIIMADQLHSNSKITEFYNGISSASFINDREASKLLYQSTPQDYRYRKLKSRFTKRLLNTIFLVSPETSYKNSFEENWFDCHKSMGQISILLANEAYETSSYLLKKLLTRARKYKFTDVVLYSARNLRNLAIKEGDTKLFEHYTELINSHLAIYQAELQAEQLKQQVEIFLHAPRSVALANIDLIEHASNEIVALSEQYDTPRIYFNMFATWTSKYEITQDYPSLLESCDVALQYMQENKNYQDNKKSILFLTAQMSAYLHLKNYKEGKKHAESNLPKFQSGSSDWFKFMEYYLLLATHSGNYLQAIAIFQLITNNSLFTKLDRYQKEKWKIYYAYLHYIIIHYQLDSLLLNQIGYKTLNPINILQKEINYPQKLRVLQVLQLIVQVLIGINSKQFKDLPAKIAKLNYLANRILKKEDNNRTIQFIKLLNQLRKANFNYNLLSSADKYYTKLRENNFSFQVDNINGLEIISYEELWKNITQKLQ